ncbi:MAG: hypothetical protein LBT22_02685 [Peptococcaceae bacterium]|jgi:hypothetical protein|nr:hypothetical protein [Peptococcaceae bacterium]
MKTLLQGRNKFLSAILALVMAATLLGATAFTGLGSAAFAAWPSFQDDNTNNGVITVQPPITTPATQASVGLLTNNPGSVVYSGIDTTSVLNTSSSGVTTAYTLYNGGVYDAATGLGGARVAVTNLSTGSVNSVLLDAQASNDNQLSVPYYNAANDTLYAAIQWSSDAWVTPAISGWTPSATGVTISGSTATFTGNGSISASVTLTNPVNYLYLPTNFNGTTGTYTIAIDGTTLASGSLSEYGTYDEYTGPEIAAGTHTLTITVTGATSAAPATVSQVTFTRYDWRLYSVSAVTTAPVVKLLVGDSTGSNPLYEGQPNTPISYDSAGNIYWGIYGGTHSYYQYNVTNATLVSFKPTTSLASGYDDFYYAGAADVTVSGTEYVVFGSDSGTVYVRPVINFDTGTGNTITLVDSVNVPGEIRSTVVLAGANVYFTSKGATDGLLWGIAVTDLLRISTTSNDAVVKASETSTSTPVVSESGYIYVGANQLFSSGSVQAFDLTLANLAPVYSGDPVQASPIVYTDEATGDDYIYFTTNADHSQDTPPVTNHNGYCYSYLPGAATGTLVWNPSLGGTYALQGFAADNGYLVYGDDGNNLYIFH